MKPLTKYSIGLGNKLGHQGNAQLKAIIAASDIGKEAGEKEISEFLASVEKYTGDLKIEKSNLSSKQQNRRLGK